MARIISDPGTKPTRPEPAAVSVRRPAPPASRLGGLLWPALCLLQLGLIGGYIAYRTYFAPPPPQPAVSEKTKDDAPAGAGLKPGETPTVERGDELAREGRPDLALPVYQAAADAAPAAVREAIQYRVGLCLEGLGRNEAALKAFQAVAAARVADPAAVAPAELGQARVYLRQGKFTEAKSLLYPLRLRSSLPELKERPYVADIPYLLALTLAVETGRGERPSPLSDALAAYAARDWQVDAALDWYPQAKEARAKDAADSKETKEAAPVRPAADDGKRAGADESEKAGQFLHVRQLGPNPERAPVSAALPPTPLTELLDRLGGLAKLKVEWGETARKLAADRSVRLAFDNLALGDVLLALTDPLGLLATIGDGQLTITTQAETPEREREIFLAAAAARALNAVVAAYPGHALTAAAKMELADLDVRAGRLEDAAGKYERLYQDPQLRRAPVQVEASYNLGVVRLRQGQTGPARAAFYRVIDRAAGHELAALALLNIGRTHLLEGDAEHAVTPLRRAVAAAAAPPTRAAAAVALSASYLLTNNPRLAGAVLLDNREAVGQEPFRPAAQFLGAYALYLSAPGGRPAAREAGDVLGALWALPQDRTASEDRVLGSPGALLVGRAYRDLGQFNEMVVVYKKALPGLKGPVAEEMAYAVAEDYFARDQRAPAAKLYATLVKGEGGKVANEATLRLAEIALRENRARDCLTLCRKVLDPKKPATRTAALKLMGQAYEMTKEHLKAAECFAGKVPE